jgi:methionyl-tRNA formyltransferase
LDPDVIVVVAFRILPPEVFLLPRLGSFNLHASLLPQYRGAAPINWAIIRGEKETGVTTFFLEEKVDTGTLLFQERIPILPEDDAGSVHDRLAGLGAELVLKTVQAIEGGTARPLPQDERLASSAPKIFKEDCRIRWSEPAEAIHNRIRGLSPLPAAFTLHGGKTIKLYRSRVLEAPSSAPPGTIEISGDMLLVHTGDRKLEIRELQQEGKKRLGVQAFLRGYRITSGELWI